MKNPGCFLIISIVFLFSATTLPAQQNLGFELGDFTNWQGFTWIYTTDVPAINTSKVQVTLPSSRRHVIITGYYQNSTHEIMIELRIPSKVASTHCQCENLPFWYH
jgi:hypothetical protein